MDRRVSAAVPSNQLYQERSTSETLEEQIADQSLASKKKKKQHESAPAAHVYTFDDRLEPNERRLASPIVVRNRGLVPHRRQDAAHRNPRVRRRVKFAKAVIRRKGQVRAFDHKAHQEAATGSYRGETTGINKSARHSTKLRPRV